MKSGLAALIVLAGLGKAQTKELELLRENKANITHAAGSFGVSPRLLASIIYVEQSENVKPGEKFLDVVFAHSGYNSSVGISQIKVSTAEWIEEQVHSPKSPLYLGDRCRTFIRPSADLNDLVGKLAADSINLLYAAAYLALVERIWGETLDAPWLQNSRVGIHATVYSLGLIKPDGSIREPHDRARMSKFGIKAQGFFDSFLLRKEFAE